MHKETNMYTRMHIHMYTHAYTHAYMYTHMRTCLHAQGVTPVRRAVVIIIRVYLRIHPLLHRYMKKKRMHSVYTFGNWKNHTNAGKKMRI